MRLKILALLLLCATDAFSQDKNPKTFHYSYTLNATFARNANFNVGDLISGGEDSNIFEFGAVFFRNGFDVNVSKHFITGIKIGLDYHTQLDILAIPYYIDSKFVISRQDETLFYASAGIGKLLKAGKAFEKGRYFKFGLGYHIASYSKPKKYIISLDFHQKNIAHLKNGKLNSLSIGFGLLFL